MYIKYVCVLVYNMDTHIYIQKIILDRHTQIFSTDYLGEVWVEVWVGFSVKRRLTVSPICAFFPP